MNGKHVVITGASSGLGRALARAFGAEGATVWMGARREDALAEAAREVDAAGGKGRALSLDVTDDASIARFAEAIESADVLVNNAGIGAWGMSDQTDPDTWRKVIATNLTGPFLVTKAMLPKLRARSGRRQILNIASVAARTAYAGGGTYSASKFGLKGWSEALALELADEGIRVTTVMPGFIDTPLVRGVGDGSKMISPDDLAKHLVDVCMMPESMFLDELVVWPWKMYTD